MFQRRKKRMRSGVLAACVAVCMAATGAALPASAQAYTQDYCNQYVYGLDTCYSSGLHSWYYNSASTYTADYICAYMWNAHNGVIRGGSEPCWYGFVDQTFNRTSDLWYNARVVNRTYGRTLFMYGHAEA